MAKPRTGKYSEHWELLKKHGAVEIIYSKSKLSDNSTQLKRIIKAITKEKYNDTKFKLDYPIARLKISHVETDDDSKGKVIIQLTYYSAVSDLMR